MYPNAHGNGIKKKKKTEGWVLQEGKDGRLTLCTGERVGAEEWVFLVHNGKAGRVKSRDDMDNDDVRDLARCGKETGGSRKAIE